MVEESATQEPPPVSVDVPLPTAVPAPVPVALPFAGRGPVSVALVVAMLLAAPERLRESLAAFCRALQPTSGRQTMIAMRFRHISSVKMPAFFSGGPGGSAPWPP